MRYFNLFLLLFSLAPILSAQLVLERDINQEAASSSPRIFAELDGVLYFRADDGINGDELYKYDLSTETATLVAGIQPHEQGTSINEIVAFDNKIYFNARDGFSFYLYVYDPQDNSTQRLTDALGEQAKNPNSIKVFNGQLFFVADFSGVGTELARYDPISDTISLVADININGDSNPSSLNIADGQLWFAANDEQSNSRLWRYDPVTDMLENILYNTPAEIYPNFNKLYYFEGKLFFTHFILGKGEELWFYDVATNTLFEVPEIYPGAGSATPSGFIAFEDKLYFRARDLNSGMELRVYDPTTAEVSLVSDIYPGNDNGSPGDLFILGNKLYYTANIDLTERSLFSHSSAGLLTEASLDNAGELNYMSGLIVADNRLFLSCRIEETGQELYQFIPGSNEISLAADINLTTIGSDPYGFTPYNGKLYFGATEINTGRNIWVYNPATGIVELLDEMPGNVRPNNFQVLDGKLYFSGIDPDVGYGILVYDDATGQITPTSFITPNAIGGITDITAYNGLLYYKANDDLLGRELFSYNPLNDEYRIVADINPTGSANPERLFVYNNELYFEANDGSNGVELWKYNDATDQATLVLDINPGEAGSQPSGFLIFDGELYFSAFVNDLQYDLYSYNSLSGVLTQRTDIIGSLNPQYLTIYRDKIFFQGRYSSSTNVELLYYDPATNELVLTEDLSPGASNPRDLIVFNDKLYFSAFTPDYGRELWEYNDTTLAIVADIRSGVPTADPTSLTLFNDKLYFSANDGLRGSELWSVAQCLNIFIDTEPHYEQGELGAIELTIEGGTPPYTINWNNGEETQRIENLQAGVYTAVITDASGCLSEISAEVSFLTSTESLLSAEKASLFPNPNQGSFVVETDGLMLEILEIFDTKGSLVYQKIIQNNTLQTTVNLDYAVAGIYYLKLTTREGVIQKKFIKK